MCFHSVFLYIFLSVALESKRCWLNDSSLFCKRLNIHQFNVQTATGENIEKDTLSNVISIPSNPFKLWLFPLRSTLKQALHRCRQITWKIPVMVFIFLRKLFRRIQRCVNRCWKWRLFRRCLTLLKPMLKYIMLIRRCSTL